MACVNLQTALRENVDGEVILACKAAGAGVICRVTQEFPRGYGFGDAALNLFRNLAASGGAGKFSTAIRFKAAGGRGRAPLWVVARNAKEPDGL